MQPTSGALLGLAVGDALGTTLEFTRPGPFPFEPLVAGPHIDIKGGGPFSVAPGQVTDDTQMACCIADSLRERGRLDLRDIAGRYADWRRVAFDIGNQTASAIDSFASLDETTSPTEAGRRVWEQAGRRPAGNGSLMRTAPIGVFFAADPVARLRASMDESALTHFDPRCQLACAALNAAIAAAITTKRPTADNLTAAARDDLDRGADRLRTAHRELTAEIDQALAALLTDLQAAETSDPDLYRADLHLHDHQGFVRVAFRLAFWHLHHAPSFEAALIDTANRGGDADTNAAIVGALLGAAHGERAIPERWKAAVLGALENGPATPFRDLYHPRALVALADHPSHRCALHILRSVFELHKLGYQRVRIAPGMSPSGMHWRCSITHVRNIRETHGAMLAGLDADVAHYSSSQESEYFGWTDAKRDTAKQLAETLIRRFPWIARHGHGRDWPYAGWYVEMLGLADKGALPVAYADWTEDREPGQLPTTGGADIRLPMPPGGEARR